MFDRYLSFSKNSYLLSVYLDISLMKSLVSILLLLLFVQCSGDDDPRLLNRDYFVGSWQIDDGRPILIGTGDQDNQTEDDQPRVDFRFEADGRVSFGVQLQGIEFSGRWSYDDLDRELLIERSGLETYIISNYTNNQPIWSSVFGRRKIGVFWTDSITLPILALSPRTQTPTSP